MKGMTAELCAKTMKSPKTSRQTASGVSHHHLFCQKKATSSPAMPRRWTNPAANRIALPRRRLLDDIVAEHEHVHPTPMEGLERFGGGVDDGLALEVEGGVEDDRHARGLAERLDELVVARAVRFAYARQA